MEYNNRSNKKNENKLNEHLVKISSNVLLYLFFGNRLKIVCRNYYTEIFVRITYANVRF